MPSPELHLAVALDGTGWHPAAWREPDARPDEIFTARYWASLAQEAERGLLDFITIEDALGLQSAGWRKGPDERTDQVRGRLDAVLIAARIAPLTTSIGIVPTGTITHTEPFHMSTALATLDYVSGGRAGWRPQLSSRPEQARHFGRREIPPAEELFGEGADYVEVVRRLWDSWEDDAVIRDVPTGRFIDRDKLHYIDFEGQRFAIRGPSITPRPPQGQLPVIALAHSRVPFEFAARTADVVLITPANVDDAIDHIAEVRAAEIATKRTGPPLSIYADLTVFFGPDEAAAVQRRERLDAADGSGSYLPGGRPPVPPDARPMEGQAYRARDTDALIFTNTPEHLADLMLDWLGAGLDGFRLRPGVIPHDLEQITRELVPALQARGVFRAQYPAGILRRRLGLEPHPASRYAREGVT